MGSINKLPSDIIFNILTRLPAETVLDCKLVSKTWNHIISYRSFPKEHFTNCLSTHDSSGDSGKFTYLLLNNNPIYGYKQFHYLEYDEDKDFDRVTRMRINPAPFIYYKLTGSVNGLLCLNGCHNNEWVNYEPAYICNPITRECVFLPPFKRTTARCERLVTGFGYLSKTNEYKVVRMYYLEKEPNSIRVEVYTLGSGKGWRNLGKKMNKKLKLFGSIHGVLLNEFLYWDLKDGKIVSFDLANEELAELPNSFPAGWSFRLGVLRGHLSATHYDEGSKTHDILLLKEKKEDGSLNRSKKKKQNRSKKKEDGSMSWTKEFSIRDIDAIEFLGLSRSGTVLCRSDTKVHIHGLNSSSSKLVVDFGKHREMFQAIPHMNTLVSIKALGEKNTKTMETFDVPREVIDRHAYEHAEEAKRAQAYMLQLLHL